MALTMDVNMRWSMHEAVVMPPVPKAEPVTAAAKPKPKQRARPTPPPTSGVLVQMLDDGSTGWLTK